MHEMTETFICPRAGEGYVTPYNGGMAHWRDDHTCSYCGSLSEGRFFAAIEAGAELTPTDKNYKVYVGTTEAVPMMQTYRACPFDATCTGPDDCTHWVTRPMSKEKFYFQHLSPDGRTKFIDLYNQKTMKIGIPGSFYVTPFFCTPVGD